jgi:hypothetical protein
MGRQLFFLIQEDSIAPLSAAVKNIFLLFFEMLQILTLVKRSHQKNDKSKHNAEKC